MVVDSELPVVIKAYFYLSAASTATAASVSLDVSYSDGSAEEGFGLVDFGASSGDGVSGTWTQGISALYPTKVVSSATVRDRRRGLEEKGGGVLRRFFRRGSREIRIYRVCTQGGRVPCRAVLCCAGETVVFRHRGGCLRGRGPVRAPRRRLPLRSWVLPGCSLRAGEKQRKNRV